MFSGVIERTQWHEMGYHHDNTLWNSCNVKAEKQNQVTANKIQLCTLLEVNRRISVDRRNVRSFFKKVSLLIVRKKRHLKRVCWYLISFSKQFHFKQNFQIALYILVDRLLVLVTVSLEKYFLSVSFFVA